MRLRLLIAAVAFALGSATFAVPPAGAVSFNCEWTTLWADPIDHYWRGHVEAGPLLEPDATSVEVICELRRDEPSGAVMLSDSQTRPGPIGFYDEVWQGYGGALGVDFYVCTYTVPYPANTKHALGCKYAFTT